MSEFEFSDTLERMTCVMCGVNFAMTKDFIGSRRQDPKKVFHCPNGHSLCWPAAKTYEDLTKEIATLTSQIQNLQKENVGLRSQTDQLEAKLAEAKA